jgi:hypothetical protein
MSDMLNAKAVGDSWRDATGGISTVAAILPDRVIVRRKGSGWAVSNTAYAADYSAVIPPTCKTLADAIAA